jgi:hypothetical protein
MYSFKKNLGYFVANNATNNNTAVAAVGKRYNKKGILFNAI